MRSMENGQHNGEGHIVLHNNCPSLLASSESSLIPIYRECAGQAVWLPAICLFCACLERISESHPQHSWSRLLIPQYLMPCPLRSAVTVWFLGCLHVCLL